jgi:PIN domain nuclease of toxin-antitoxin system
LRLLLDTHIWLWSLIDPARVGKRTLAELESKSNELWLSSISIWEALILHQKKRIYLSADLNDWIARNTSRFREANLTHEIATAAALLQLQHKDPADRFLVATAQVFDLTLVTADANLLGLGDIATLANR